MLLTQGKYADVLTYASGTTYLTYSPATFLSSCLAVTAAFSPS